MATDNEKPSFESALRAALARLDCYFAKDDDADKHDLDPQYTLEEVERLLRAALPDTEPDDTPVGATEDLTYDD